MELTRELLDELETYVKSQRLSGEWLPDVVYFTGATALALIAAARELEEAKRDAEQRGTERDLAAVIELTKENLDCYERSARDFARKYGNNISMQVNVTHLLALIAAARELENRQWIPVLDSDDMIQCDEGQPYLFAIQMAGGAWEMFVNRLVWDSETEPYWGDDDPGWEPDHGMFFSPRPSPPEPTNGR